MTEIRKVELTISSLINDLNSGLSWLAKDDIGAGSIQAKYDATDMQILVIKQHPKLINIEPVRTVFEIIDDTEPVSKKSPTKVQESVVDTEVESDDLETVGAL